MFLMVLHHVLSELITIFLDVWFIILPKMSVKNASLTSAISLELQNNVLNLYQIVLLMIKQILTLMVSLFALNVMICSIYQETLSIIQPYV